MDISLIAAMDRNRLIGKTGALYGLPWDLPDDRAFFKEMSKGKPMIMGRKTYEAVGRLLPDRVSIILTHDREYTVDGAIVVHSPKEALDTARAKAQELGVDEIMVSGGGQVFAAFLPRADRMYLTFVDGVFSGNAYFPEFNRSEWVEVNRDHHPVDDQHAYPFDIVTYERVNSKR